MSVPDTAAQLRWTGMALLTLSLATMGCALFSPADLTREFAAQRPVLPPIKAPADAIQLQIVFIERPADDPLVTNLVWHDLDQVGAIPPGTRHTLEQNGFRIGQAGANPPPALQKLLGLTGEVVDAELEDRQLMRGRRLGLRSAQETEIQTLDEFQNGSVRYQLGNKEEVVQYEQSRSVLKLRPVRVQNGWVRVEFTPEIHHGDSRLRHTPTDEGWALRGGQQADSRHALKFHVMLNNGEMAVVSGDLTRPDSAGARFFSRDVDGRKSQRVLVIRLADAGRSDEQIEQVP